MPTDAVALVRRFYQLAGEGDGACWELWDENAVALAPPEWPESGEGRGLDQIRRGFSTWASAFGDRWWEGIEAENIDQVSDGRVLVDLNFDFEGGRSGAPVHQRASALYTLHGGKIVRAEHFMDRAGARAAAGV
jgi:ketosteroid isomerase-like protein